jgi:hypothetical protein
MPVPVELTHMHLPALEVMAATVVPVQRAIYQEQIYLIVPAVGVVHGVVLRDLREDRRLVPVLVALRWPTEAVAEVAVKPTMDRVYPEVLVQSLSSTDTQHNIKILWD